MCYSQVLTGLSTRRPTIPQKELGTHRFSLRQKNVVPLWAGSRNGKQQVVTRLKGTGKREALWQGGAGTAAELETRWRLQTQHVRTAQRVLTLAASFSRYWIDVARPDGEGLSPCPPSPS